MDVSIFRMYGLGRSAGFNIIDRNSGNTLFKIDLDVNRSNPQTKVYQINNFCFRGVVPRQIIADKVSAISTDKVFRRVKDVIDLYYISNVFDFDKDEILQTIKENGRSLDTFHGFLYRCDDLKHAYEKFRLSGGVYKPVFEEVYETVKLYLKDILPND